MGAAARLQAYYAENGIDLRLGTRIAALNPRDRLVVRWTTAAPSLTTGCCSQPVPSRFVFLSRVPRLRISSPCAALADCRHIIARAGSATRVLVIGDSLIGLEGAASA